MCFVVAEKDSLRALKDKLRRTLNEAQGKIREKLQTVFKRNLKDKFRCIDCPHKYLEAKYVPSEEAFLYKDFDEAQC